MKKFTFLSVFVFLIFHTFSYAQMMSVSDDENGDWAEQYVELYDTPEAEMMVRSGDIDNLGFGWPAEFDPFSGQSTPSHGYPWEVDSTDAPGTDRIMVVSSYNGSPPHGQDGYTSYTSRPENLPRPIVLNYNLNGLIAETAALQIFVDDFQAPNWHANYFVTINGVNAPYIANTINALSQTGPIGKIINITLPAEHMYLIEHDSLSILLDDTSTGAGDGYAIDFVKLLINPKGFTYTAKVFGYVTQEGTGNAIENAIVTASGTNEIMTNAEGYYIFSGLPAGLNNLFASKFSYDTSAVVLDLKEGDSIRKDFVLKEILDAEFVGDVLTASTLPHTVNFTDMTSMNPTEWLWDFGDGSTSTEQNPTHIYYDGGFFTVTLTANNGIETNTEVKETYIKILIEGVEEYNIISDVLTAPNPAINDFTVSFNLVEPAYLKIELFNIKGKLMRLIGEDQFETGKHSIPCKATDLSEGIYFIQFHAGNNSLTKKVLVLK